MQRSFCAVAAGRCRWFIHSSNTVFAKATGTALTMVKPRQKAVISSAIDELLCFYRELFEISGRNSRLQRHCRTIHLLIHPLPRSTACPTARPRAQTRNRASSATGATATASSWSHGIRWTLAPWWTANRIRFDMLVSSTCRPDQAVGAQRSALLSRTGRYWRRCQTSRHAMIGLLCPWPLTRAPDATCE